MCTIWSIYIYLYIATTYVCFILVLFIYMRYQHKGRLSHCRIDKNSFLGFGHDQRCVCRINNKFAFGVHSAHANAYVFAAEFQCEFYLYLLITHYSAHTMHLCIRSESTSAPAQIFTCCDCKIASRLLVCVCCVYLCYVCQLEFKFTPQ